MGTPTSYSAAVADSVNTAITTTGITHKALAEATGIPRTTLTRRLAGQSPFTVAELDAIALALNIDVTTLVVAGVGAA